MNGLHGCIEVRALIRDVPRNGVKDQRLFNQRDYDYHRVDKRLCELSVLQEPYSAQ